MTKKGGSSLRMAAVVGNLNELSDAGAEGQAGFVDGHDERAGGVIVDDLQADARGKSHIHQPLPGLSASFKGNHLHFFALGGEYQRQGAGPLNHAPVAQSVNLHFFFTN